MSKTWKYLLLVSSFYRLRFFLARFSLPTRNTCRTKRRKITRQLVVRHPHPRKRRSRRSVARRWKPQPTSACQRSTPESETFCRQTTPASRRSRPRTHPPLSPASEYILAARRRLRRPPGLTRNPPDKKRCRLRAARRICGQATWTSRSRWTLALRASSPVFRQTSCPPVFRQTSYPPDSRALPRFGGALLRLTPCSTRPDIYQQMGQSLLLRRRSHFWSTTPTWPPPQPSKPRRPCTLTFRVSSIVPPRRRRGLRRPLFANLLLWRLAPSFRPARLRPPRTRPRRYPPPETRPPPSPPSPPRLLEKTSLRST